MMEQEARFVIEVIDKMADQALENGARLDIAIERFSAGIDRLMTWLPVELRLDALEQARSHGYCTPDQIRTMRDDLNPP